MANTMIFGHLLEELTDGVTVFREGVGKPMPLTSTCLDIDVTAGLALVVTTRTFLNREDVPIEAILTMPVGFNAVVTGLSATIDGRTLRAAASPKAAAREVYEEAIDRGKMAVLHEEVLRGIHVLSVGQLAPGKEVSIELRTVVPLAASGSGPFLRLPMTAGQLYGATPLQPADDMITDATVRHLATLRVRTDVGVARLGGIGPIAPEEAVEVALDRAIEIVVEGGQFGTLLGVSANGHQVRVDLRPQSDSNVSLKLAILVDRSGSTASKLANGLDTVLSAIRSGLADALSATTDADHIALWQFSDDCRRLGTGRGTEILQILAKLNDPDGGTKLGGAIKKIAATGIQDILVLTDGQTWDTLPPLAAELQIRVSAVLVGKASLDANIGHLCAMTGGDLFYAPDADVSSCVRLALNSKRSSPTLRRIDLTDGQAKRVQHGLGGVEITATWSDAMEIKLGSDIGRFAAALCLGLLDEEAATDLAVAEGLCSHVTSLILVDETGEASSGLSETRKVPLMAKDQRGVPMPLDSAIQAPPVLPMRRQAFPFVGQEGRSGRSVEKRVQVTEAQQARSIKDAAAERAAARIWYEDNPLTVLDDEPVVVNWKAKKRKETENYLTVLADGIDWDSQSNRFISGDFEGLLPEEEAVLTALTEHAGVGLIVQKSKVHPTLFLLAWLASRFVTHSRSARRFAKKVLDHITDGDIMIEVENQVFRANGKSN